MAKSLHKALQLYDILGKYLPANLSQYETLLDYVQAIIANIRDGGTPMDYILATQLMTEAEYDILISSGSDAILEAFMQGLMEWHVYEMREFFGSLGYSHGR